MLKKLIASGSIAVIALSSLANGLVLGATAVTDPELIQAVSWANDAGLTKYSDADAFMPYNNLTREQAAKFASEFAESQLAIFQAEKIVNIVQSIEYALIQILIDFKKGN